MPGETYRYTLADVNYSGEETRHSDCSVNLSIPIGEMPEVRHFQLKSVYPNPFNSTFTLNFSLDLRAHVKLLLYDVNGRLVMHLLNQSFSAGEYSWPVDSSALASGTYFLKSRSGHVVAHSKIILIK